MATGQENLFATSPASGACLWRACAGAFTPERVRPMLPKKRRIWWRKRGVNIPDSPVVDVPRTWEWEGRQAPWASRERHRAARRPPNQASPARTCSPRADSWAPCRQAGRRGSASGHKRRSGSEPRWRDLWRGQLCLFIPSLCLPPSLSGSSKNELFACDIPPPGPLPLAGWG